VKNITAACFTLKEVDFYFEEKCIFAKTRIENNKKCTSE